MFIDITLDTLDNIVYTLDKDDTCIKYKKAGRARKRWESTEGGVPRIIFSVSTCATSFVLASIIPTATTVDPNYSPTDCLANSKKSAFCCLPWRRTNRAIGWYCGRSIARLPDQRSLQRIAEFLKLTGTTH
jgi:hypothetical protein